MKTLKSMRLHIGVFGKTNVGKSSLLNRITNQEISIVSDIAGTTTDVVEKSMELLPVGPVTFLDTAGLDDSTELGEKRIEKTMKIVNRIDVGVIVCDFNGLDDYEKELIAKFDELKIPYLIVVNKCDIKKTEIEGFKNVLYTSVKNDDRLVFKFKEALVKLLPDDFVNSPKIAGDLVPEKSTVILVIPIDKEAPKGRIILPQVQTIRDLLDSNCLPYVVKETELKHALENLKKCIEEQGSIQRFNACVNVFELYVQNFKKKYENKSESLKESYIDVLNTNYYAKLLGNLKYDSNYYARYIPTNQGKYSKENIAFEEKKLLDRINRTLFLLNNEN